MHSHLYGARRPAACAQLKVRTVHPSPHLRINVHLSKLSLSNQIFSNRKGCSLWQRVAVYSESHTQPTKIQYTDKVWAGIAQSVQRLATGWTIRGSNPGGGEIFRTRPDRPWGPLSLPYNGYRVFPVTLTTHHHLVLRLRKEYSCTSTPRLGLLGLFQGELYLYLYNKYIYGFCMFLILETKISLRSKNSNIL